MIATINEYPQRRGLTMTAMLTKNRFVIGTIILGAVLVCGVMGIGFFGFSANEGMRMGEAAAPPPPSDSSVGGEILSRQAVNSAASLPTMTPAPTASPASVAANDPARPQQAQPVERLIIRNGTMTLVVEDTRVAQADIETMVAEMAGEGAFVVSSEEKGGLRDESPRITMQIRVPVGRFAQVMDDLAALAVEVSARNESGQDVTEEYVDLQARLESLDAARQRLLEIMQEARTTEDLLRAEQQLTQREADIESIKGRLQYLSQAAQLSSIHITLNPDRLSQPVDTRWQPGRTALDATETLVDSAQGFGDFLIFFIIAWLPWLVGMGLVIYLIVRVSRWQWQRRQRATN